MSPPGREWRPRASTTFAPASRVELSLAAPRPGNLHKRRNRPNDPRPAAPAPATAPARPPPTPQRAAPQPPPARHHRRGTTDATTDAQTRPTATPSDATARLELPEAGSTRASSAAGVEPVPSTSKIPKAWRRSSSTAAGSGGVECGELVEAKGAVAVGVHLGHPARQLVGRAAARRGARRPQTAGPGRSHHRRHHDAARRRQPTPDGGTSGRTPPERRSSRKDRKSVV